MRGGTPRVRRPPPVVNYHAQTVIHPPPKMRSPSHPYLSSGTSLADLLNSSEGSSQPQGSYSRGTRNLHFGKTLSPFVITDIPSPSAAVGSPRRLQIRRRGSARHSINKLDTVAACRDAGLRIKTQPVSEGYGLVAAAGDYWYGFRRWFTVTTNSARRCRSR
jgi:hypothetical protein